MVSVYQPSSPTFDLTALQLPLVLKHNEPATVSVQVKGHPAPEVKWFVDQQQVLDSMRYQLRMKGSIHTIIITRVDDELSAGLWLVASNGVGQNRCWLPVKVYHVAQGTSSNAEVDAKEEVTMETEEYKKWLKQMEERNKMRSIDDILEDDQSRTSSEVLTAWDVEGEKKEPASAAEQPGMEKNSSVQDSCKSSRTKKTPLKIPQDDHVSRSENLKVRKSQSNKLKHSVVDKKIEKGKKRTALQCISYSFCSTDKNYPDAEPMPDYIPSPSRKQEQLVPPAAKKQLHILENDPLWEIFGLRLSEFCGKLLTVKQNEKNLRCDFALSGHPTVSEHKDNQRNVTSENRTTRVISSSHPGENRTTRVMSSSHPGENRTTRVISSSHPGENCTTVNFSSSVKSESHLPDGDVATAAAKPYLESHFDVDTNDVSHSELLNTTRSVITHSSVNVTRPLNTHVSEPVNTARFMTTITSQNLTKPVNKPGAVNSNRKVNTSMPSSSRSSDMDNKIYGRGLLSVRSPQADADLLLLKASIANRASQYSSYLRAEFPGKCERSPSRRLLGEPLAEKTLTVFRLERASSDRKKGDAHKLSSDLIDENSRLRSKPEDTIKVTRSHSMERSFEPRTENRLFRDNYLLVDIDIDSADNNKTLPNSKHYARTTVEVETGNATAIKSVKSEELLSQTTAVSPVLPGSSSTNIYDGKKVRGSRSVEMLSRSNSSSTKLTKRSVSKEWKVVRTTTTEEITIVKKSDLSLPLTSLREGLASSFPSHNIPSTTTVSSTPEQVASPSCQPENQRHSNIAQEINNVDVLLTELHLNDGTGNNTQSAEKGRATIDLFSSSSNTNVDSVDLDGDISVQSTNDSTCDNHSSPLLSSTNYDRQMLVSSTNHSSRNGTSSPHDELDSHPDDGFLLVECQSTCTMTESHDTVQASTGSTFADVLSSLSVADAMFTTTMTTGVVDDIHHALHDDVTQPDVIEIPQYDVSSEMFIADLDNEFGVFNLSSDTSVVTTEPNDYSLISNDLCEVKNGFNDELLKFTSIFSSGDHQIQSDDPTTGSYDPYMPFADPAAVLVETSRPDETTFNEPSLDLILNDLETLATDLDNSADDLSSDSDSRLFVS